MDSFVEIIIFLAVAVFTAIKFFADKKKHGNNAEKKEKKTAEKASQVTQITLTLEDLREIKDMIGQGMSLQQAKEELFARKERAREEAEARERAEEQMALRQAEIEKKKAVSPNISPSASSFFQSNGFETKEEIRRKAQKALDVHQVFSDAELLRRAFVVQEILKKPIALRSESESEYYAESM